MDNTMFVHHQRTQYIQSEKFLSQFGDLKLVKASFSFLLENDNDIRLKKDLEPTGALGDLGWYCVKWISIFYEWDIPTKVFSECKYHKNGSILSLNAILWYQDGKMAQLDCSFDMTFQQVGEVIGKNGSFIIDDFVLPRTDKTKVFIYKNGEKSTLEFPDCIQETELIKIFSKGIGQSWSKESIVTQKILDIIFESTTQKKFVLNV